MQWARLADGVTKDELSHAKNYLTGTYPLRFDSNAVTREDVARVARDVLDLDRLNFVLVGRPQGM